MGGAGAEFKPPLEKASLQGQRLGRDRLGWEGAAKAEISGIIAGIGDIKAVPETRQRGGVP